MNPAIQKFSNQKTYRLTRNRFGSHPLEDRQGYYISAKSPEEAMAKMKVRFPDDKEGFTIQLWC